MSGEVSPAVCPAGYYCGPSTEYGTQLPCPVGTYSSATKLQNITQCLACSPGHYCGSSGLTSPTGPCSAGFYCGGGASYANQSDSYHEDRSYAGDTCVNATKHGLNNECPPGTTQLNRMESVVVLYAVVVVV